MEKEVAQDILSVKGEETEELLNSEVSNIPLIPITDLPSGFKGYPKGTQISFKPITLGELEALNSGDTVDFNRGVAMLLDSIHCTTMEAYDLYYWDVIYIGIKRKLLAFGNTKGTIRQRCPNCGNVVSKSFNIDEISFKELEAPDLPMKLEVCGKKLEFYPISMKEFLLLSTEEGERGVFARMIRNMPFEEAFELVSNAYGVDIKKLRFVDEKLNYGINPFIVECNGSVEEENPNFDAEKPESKTNSRTIEQVCNEKVAVEVRSPFEVVFPEDETGDDIGFEVQYG